MARSVACLQVRLPRARWRPAGQVDSVYTRVRLSMNEGVVCVGNAVTMSRASKVQQVTVKNVGNMSDGGTEPQQPQRRQCKTMTDCPRMSMRRTSYRRCSSRYNYGRFARETISDTEFVYEYTGAMLLQEEAERRGLI
ncbi:hypothetical protein JG687_00010381 [Phytophthora cactorum]|uniref:Uncharacterized protein n=1 Tax=Phytophthora cactorum TaxID=29920 RepID=A0A8T1U7F7_9STRA|nr:hypothetical protein GQ600_6358 [Phytophthora cactorum]KAG6956805.1 hypothetical protein JG687_00010381 [Phytophthora cactorum]